MKRKKNQICYFRYLRKLSMSRNTVPCTHSCASGLQNMLLTSNLPIPRSARECENIEHLAPCSTYCSSMLADLLTLSLPRLPPLNDCCLTNARMSSRIEQAFPQVRNRISTKREIQFSPLSLREASRLPHRRGEVGEVHG